MKKLIFACLLCTATAFAQQQTYTETFDAPAEKWPAGDDGKVSMAYKSGALVIDAYEQGYMKFRGMDYLVDLNSDYTIETRIKFVLGVRTSGYGIAWGYKSWSDYNVFLLANDGNMKIVNKTNDKDNIVMDWKKIPKKTLKKETEYNTLRVAKKGKLVTFYINDKEIFQSASSSFAATGRKVGIMLQNNMKVSVDELKITSREMKINLVENPVNGFKLENLGDNVNGKESDRSPLISPDGQTLYYTSTEPAANFGETDIWEAHLGSDNVWQPARHMDAPLNNAGHNFVISITPDGNSMLVGNTYNADGSAKGAGVSLSLKRNGVWTTPVEQVIEGYVNNNAYCNFFLTADGTKLLMSIQNSESIGEKDLYISFLKGDNAWTKPQQMGNVINSFGGDYCPFVAADGKTMYFASDGHPGYGSSDIYVTRRLDDTWLNWETPRNLGPEINTDKWEAYYCIPAKGNYAYMVSSGQGFGSEDIFRIKVAEDARPDPVVMVKGEVYNKKTNERVEANITYESLSNPETKGKAYSTMVNGFAIALPKGSLYGFQAQAPGFIPVSENIDLTNLEAYAEKTVKLYLVPIEKGQVVRLNNIFFDFAKSNLRPESNTELDRLVELLSKNPDMKIEIGGHTDNKGSDQFNMQLSNDRAKAVYDYVLGKNITAARISFKGYGETRPVAGNDTEEGMQLNRRVEFTIK